MTPHFGILISRESFFGSTSPAGLLAGCFCTIYHLPFIIYHLVNG